MEVIETDTLKIVFTCGKISETQSIDYYFNQSSKPHFSYRKG